MALKASQALLWQVITLLACWFSDNDVGFCLIYPLQFHAPHVTSGNVFFEFKIDFSSNVPIVKGKFEF